MRGTIAALVRGDRDAAPPGRAEPGRGKAASIPAVRAEPGVLYSVEDGEGRYAAVKVLDVTPHCILVRLYRNRWPERPQAVDCAELELGSLRLTDGLSISRLPLGHRGFESWKPAFLCSEELSEEERQSRNASAGGDVFYLD